MGVEPAASGTTPPLFPDRRARWRFALYAGHLLTLFGLAVSNAFLGLALLAAPFSREAGDRPLARGRALLAAAGLYVFTLLVAAAFSTDRPASVGALRELFTLAALPLALLALRDERRVRWLVDALILVAALLAVFGLAQFLFGYGSIDRRIRGPFSHVMTFSGVLMLVDLLLIARLMFPPPSGSLSLVRPAGWLDRKWIAWACLALVNVALMQSLTRSAWLGLTMALLGLIWLRAKRWLLAVPVALALFVLVAPVPVVARALSSANLSDESSYDRLCMLEAGLRMVSANPLTGIGPEVAELVYPIYRHPTASRLNVPHLHNSYLQLAAERGLPALVAYLALFAVAARAAWNDHRREARASARATAHAGGVPRADLRLGALAALVAFSVAAWFEFNWGDTEVQRMALFVLVLPFCLRSTQSGPRNVPTATAVSA